MATGGDMRRRGFLTSLGGISALWPLAASTQQALPTLGFLNSASPHGSYESAVSNFLRGLSESGFEPGRNVNIEYAWAEGRYERLPELIEGLVLRKVAVIAATSTPAVVAARKLVTTIPVVFTTSGDPVAMGLVTSLSRPGGNFTGATQLNVEVAPKRLEVLHETLPKATQFGLLLNPTNPVANSVTNEFKSAASTLGLNLQIFTASNDRELSEAFATMAERKIEGLVIGTDNFYYMKSTDLAASAMRLKLPAIFQYDAFVDSGGLISLGGHVNESYRIAGNYAGRILKGEKPANLAVQQVTKVELILNLRTAKSIGIAIPETLRGRADRIVE